MAVQLFQPHPQVAKLRHVEPRPYTSAEVFRGQFRELGLYMRPQPEDILRSAIRDCGLSIIELARGTGVSRPAITRFLRGADITLSTTSNIATDPGLSLKKSP